MKPRTWDQYWNQPEVPVDICGFVLFAALMFVQVTVFWPVFLAAFIQDRYRRPPCTEDVCP